MNLTLENIIPAKTSSWVTNFAIISKVYNSKRVCTSICIYLNISILKSINPKGNRPWIFIGRTDAEVEAPILWPPDAKSHLIEKDLDAGKDQKQKKKRAAEDEMVR